MAIFGSLERSGDGDSASACCNEDDTVPFMKTQGHASHRPLLHLSGHTLGPSISTHDALERSLTRQRPS